MNSNENGRIVTGLDIGTSKVLAIVGEVMPSGLVEVIGVGQAPSAGVRKGVVAQLDATASAIEKSIEEAERMAGISIESVYAGVTGAHIRGHNSRGVVAVSHPGREIGERDVERVLEAAQAVSMPSDRTILHVIPQQFLVDDQDGVKEPIGMTGVRLEVQVHIVSALSSAAENILRAVNRAGLTVNDLVLEPFASSEAVLTEDEKELGVALVDLGCGTTSTIVFAGGGIWSTEVFPLGGQHVTNDLALVLRMAKDAAETVKIRAGHARLAAVDPNEAVEIPSIGGRMARPIPRTSVAEVVEPRMREILGMASAAIRRSGHPEMLGGGVVLTGAAAQMPGTADLAEEVFGLPVRLASPKGIGGLVDVVNGPGYATGVGLALYGAKWGEDENSGQDESKGLAYLKEKVLSRIQNLFAA